MSCSLYIGPNFYMEHVVSVMTGLETASRCVLQYERLLERGCIFSPEDTKELELRREAFEWWKKELMITKFLWDNRDTSEWF